MTAENVRIQEIILTQTPVFAAHHPIICHRTNNWRGGVFEPNVTKWQYLLTKKKRYYLNVSTLSHLSSVINKIRIIGPFSTRVLLSETGILGSDFQANLTKISPIKMKS